jgi:prepilin-type N-terminal cleavage/methylation domain-containing protein
MRNTEKNVDNRGFSLVELLIAMTILMVLTMMVFIGIGTSRRRDAERYAKELQNQIQLTQTTALSRAGQWRIALYRDTSGRYYCVTQHSDAADGTQQEESWVDYGKRTELGREGAIHWAPEAGGAGDAAAQQGADTRIWSCRFDSNTGERVAYDGTLLVSGAGTCYRITVYRENGYCEVEKQ